jgi:hypothetical protein
MSDLPQRELALQQSNATFGGPTQSGQDMIDLLRLFHLADESF